MCGSYQGEKLIGPSASLPKRLEVLILVPARPHAQDRLRRPALLDQLARQQHRVVEPADHEQRVGIGRLGLRHFDGQVARGRIVGDLLGDRVRHVEFRHDRADALGHGGAVGVVDVHEHDRLRRRTGGGEHLLLVREGIAQDHRRGREIPEHELVTLLGDRRRRGDIDDQRNAFLLGDLGDRRRLAGIEGADQELRAVADHLFSARAGGIDIRFGVDVHDRELGQAERLEDRRRNIDAELTSLADAGLQAGTRQQHADLQRAALGAHDIERRDAGNKCGGAGAGAESCGG